MESNSTSQGQAGIMTPEARPKPTVAEAVRWARAAALLNPGIQFSAIIEGRVYSYEADRHYPNTVRSRNV